MIKVNNVLMSHKMRSYGSQYRVYQKVIFGNTTNILCCIYVQHFLQPIPWILSLQYNASFIANGISRDTAGGASVNMYDDIVGKRQQEILTFYIQSQYFHLVFCTLSSFLSSSTN